MNKKHKRTLELVYKEPVQANIVWKDVESLFLSLGAEISEGSGSRVRVALNGSRATFHRPHPQKEANKGTIRSVCRFLDNAGVKL